MPLTLSAIDTGLDSSGFASKTILQTSYGFNITAGSQTFGTRSAFGHVPGRLTCLIRPHEIGNKITLEAHLYWGGWQGANQSGAYDCAANFRFMKRVNNGRWSFAGSYGGDPVPGTSGTYGVGTGAYRYNWVADSSNATSMFDEMMVQDTVTEIGLHEYAVMWACGYEANSRTLLWNRNYNTGNSYNPFHTCTIVATEVKA